MNGNFCWNFPKGFCSVRSLPLCHLCSANISFIIVIKNIVFIFHFSSYKSSTSQIVFRTILPRFDLLNPGEGPSLCRQCSWHKCFPHLQARHVGLGAGNHGGSLLQDKALGAGRHCGLCSPLLGSISSGCLRTGRTRTPLEGNAAHNLHSTQLDTHIHWTYCRYIYDQTWSILVNSAIATVQFHMSLFKRGEVEDEEHQQIYILASYCYSSPT